MSKYNPNNYCTLVMTKEGYVLGFYNNSNIITDVNDKVLCTTSDFVIKCKHFTEVVEIVSELEYNVGDKINHSNMQYFVIEIEKILESEAFKVIIGK